jgi:predicted Rossmann-fold nucleotide-binding protein
MKVIVCGGRRFDQRRALNQALATLHADHKISLVVTGGASGADHLAKLWAQHERVAVCEFPANWQFEGRVAGPKRNAAMLRLAQPDLVVAFPGGAGTESMMRQARAVGVPVVEPLTHQAVSE